MQSWRRRCLAAALLAGIVLGLGCDSDDSEVSREVAQRSIVERAPPLKEVVVSQREIEREPADSARRAFLEYWSLLQFQAIADAVAKFEPGLVEFVGADRISEALKTEAAYFRSVKPRITGVRSATDGSTVLYTVKDINGVLTPRSVRWRRIGGDWLIAYDPFLDLALREAAQAATQIAVDPEAPEPGRQARQAGDRAARLQSTYLKRQLER